MKLTSCLIGLVSMASLVVAGCHELGHVDGLGDYGRAGGDVIGEVENGDTRAREIEIRTGTGRRRA